MKCKLTLFGAALALLMDGPAGIQSISAQQASQQDAIVNLQGPRRCVFYLKRQKGKSEVSGGD